MGRSKEMGKPVADLSADELRLERSRCRMMIKISGSSVTGKLIAKRLRQIERRLADLDVDQPS